MARITIVDEEDNVLGSEEREIVYQKGLIHRLIRVLLFNDKGEILLQWRSASEDTFPNTWDQSAGGHVDAGEDYETAAYRELEEELGVRDVELKFIGKFYTEGHIGEKTIKRFNALYSASYSGDFKLQLEEVDRVKWFTKDELLKDIEMHPEDFTEGLRSIIKRYEDAL